MVGIASIKRGRKLDFEAAEKAIANLHPYASSNIEERYNEFGGFPPLEEGDSCGDVKLDNLRSDLQGQLDIVRSHYNDGEGTDFLYRQRFAAVPDRDFWVWEDDDGDPVTIGHAFMELEDCDLLVVLGFDPEPGAPGPGKPPEDVSIEEAFLRPLYFSLMDARQAENESGKPAHYWEAVYRQLAEEGFVKKEDLPGCGEVWNLTDKGTECVKVAV
jgi:hypothetical protein